MQTLQNVCPQLSRDGSEGGERQIAQISSFFGPSNFTGDDDALDVFDRNNHQINVAIITVTGAAIVNVLGVGKTIIHSLGIDIFVALSAH